LEKTEHINDNNHNQAYSKKSWSLKHVFCGSCNIRRYRPLTDNINIYQSESFDNALLGLTHELNNALNAGVTANLAQQATNGTISLEDFVNACGMIESTGIVYREMVAQQLNVPSGNDPGVSNAILQQQSQELNLNYSANWLWANYSTQFGASQGGQNAIDHYAEMYDAYRQP
jgi:hypothetical protein